MSGASRSTEGVRRIEDARRIAVLRANGIGDLVFCLPALEALRAAYPDARITYLGGPMHAELLPGRVPAVDEVVVVPPRPGVLWPPQGAVEDPDALERFFTEQRARNYDLAIQLHGGGANSTPFLRRLGARITVGMRDAGAPPLEREIRYVYYSSEVLRYLEVVALVGASPVTVVPRLHVLDADRAAARFLLAEVVGSRPSAPLVALNPGASDPRRRWPVEKFAAVATDLAAAGATVLVVGDAGDRGLADGILARTTARARSLAGALSIGTLVGLLERADLLVSNDTGPLHVARAVGTATVGIYWIGNMINAGPMTSDRHRCAIGWTLACPECGASLVRSGSGCAHRVSCVADVPVAEVVAASRELLERGATRP